MKSGVRLKHANHTWKWCVKRALQGISDYLCECGLISDSCVRQPTYWTSKHVHSVICLCVCVCSVWHGDDSGSGYRVRDDGHVWRSCWHWAWCLSAHSHSGREVFTSASTLLHILYTFLLKGLLFFLGMWVSVWSSMKGLSLTSPWYNCKGWRHKTPSYLLTSLTVMF